MAKPLAETNPYIGSPEANRRSVIRSCLESSAFEGAEGLKAEHLQDGDSATPRSSADTKKSRNKP